MKETKVIEHCKAVASKSSSGEILFSNKPINFYLVDPNTSEVIEENHPLKGKKVKGKVIVTPSGKGSSVVQLDGLYQLLVKGNNPAMIVIREPDPVIVSAAFICDVPLVSGLSSEFFKIIEKGGALKFNADSNTLEYNSIS